MQYFDEFNFENKGLELLASLYELRAVDNSIQTQRTCNFCILKVHNALMDDIPEDIRYTLLDSVENVVIALTNNN